ncbi:MAG: hypothetical protein H6948_16255 [Zoogloeaceae bacterium]|nr:hypothetical protein [Zoogloeaceae bacterium]
MDQQQILEELESAIEAMEQALTALAGAIAEQGDAKRRCSTSTPPKQRSEPNTAPTAGAIASSARCRCEPP